MDKVVGDFSYEGVAAIPIGEDMREWKVYFDNNFWGQPKGARAGTEIRLDREFDWAGYHWVIPAVYACEKGLVMEFCRRVEVEDIRDFMQLIITVKISNSTNCCILYFYIYSRK